MVALELDHLGLKKKIHIHLWRMITFQASTQAEQLIYILKTGDIQKENPNVCDRLGWEEGAWRTSGF